MDPNLEVAVIYPRCKSVNKLTNIIPLLEGVGGRKGSYNLLAVGNLGPDIGCPE